MSNEPNRKKEGEPLSQVKPAGNGEDTSSFTFAVRLSWQEVQNPAIDGPGIANLRAAQELTQMGASLFWAVEQLGTLSDEGVLPAGLAPAQLNRSLISLGRLGAALLQATEEHLLALEDFLPRRKTSVVDVANES